MATIVEQYELPSKGKIYDKQVNPIVSLRSMTTEEEMKRLSHSETPYLAMSSMIDACITEPIGISAYDMHFGDYQFLLHKVRVVTYGNEYPTSSVCLVCGKPNTKTIDLDSLEIISPDDNYKDLFNLVLPRSGNKLLLKFQTPRDVDEIQRELKEYQNSNEADELTNMEYLYNLKHTIVSIDGEIYTSKKLEKWLRALPMADTNAIMQRFIKLNEGVGINTLIENKCSNPKCGSVYRTRFRIGSEFFGPTVD